MSSSDDSDSDANDSVVSSSFKDTLESDGLEDEELDDEQSFYFHANSSSGKRPRLDDGFQASKVVHPNL